MEADSRPIDLQRAFLLTGRKRFDVAFHHRAIALAGDAKVDFGNGFGGDDVSARASADDADVQRDAALQIGESRNSVDLMRELEDRALPLLEIETCDGRRFQ